jgi:hypothetical protein
MVRPSGNTRLKAARQHAGYGSQQAFADALTNAGPRVGLGRMEVSVRQVRRWESSTPPWPRAEHQSLIEHVLKQPVQNLGFTPSWEGSDTSAPPGNAFRPASANSSALPLPRAAASVQPSTIGADYSAITIAHRRMYWSVQPTHLHPAVVEHTRLGIQLLSETNGVPRRVLATALAESFLLAGRISFFDLRKPDEADISFVGALQAAGDANDPLLGAAILAHAAFIPGWAQRRAESAERIRAARTYARRAPASAEFLAWLDAVEAECETLCGHTVEALRLIDRAEELLGSPNEHGSPEWFIWFSSARLAAFKGNTQLVAERFAQARITLSAALKSLGADEGKQRVVILGDLAAVEAAQQNYKVACARMNEALDQLTLTWYTTGMDRIRSVRQRLEPWTDTEEVRAVDDRIYGWETTLNALQS